MALLVKFGGIEYSYPQEGVFGCNVFSFGVGAVGVFMKPPMLVSFFKVSNWALILATRSWRLPKAVFGRELDLLFQSEAAH